MGEGRRGSNGTCSSLHRFSVTPSVTHNQIGPLWCWFPSGWARAHSRPLWVSPTTSPVRLGVSPAAAATPTGSFNQRFEALFRRWSPGLGGLIRSPPLVPVYLCAKVGSASGQTACPIRPTLRQSWSCHCHSSPLCPGCRLCPSYRSA